MIHISSTEKTFCVHFMCFGFVMERNGALPTHDNEGDIRFHSMNVAELREAIAHAAAENERLRLLINLTTTSIAECRDTQQGLQSLIDRLVAPSVQQTLASLFSSGGNTADDVIDWSLFEPSRWSEVTSTWLWFIAALTIMALSVKVLLHCAFSFGDAYRVRRVLGGFRRLAVAMRQLLQNNNRSLKRKRMVVGLLKTLAGLLFVTLFVALSLSTVSAVDTLVQFFFGASFPEAQTDETRMTSFWSFVASVPARIVGYETVDRVTFQYCLSYVGLPLFLLTASLLESAAGDFAPLDDEVDPVRALLERRAEVLERRARVLERRARALRPVLI